MTLLARTPRLPPPDNGLKCVRGVSLKSRLLESDHARRRDPLSPTRAPALSCHRQDNTGAVVCRRRRRRRRPSSLFAWIHYLGSGEVRKITDQRRTNSLTSSSCLSTFKTSCVFSSEREMRKKKKEIKRRHIDQPTQEGALHDNSLTPPQRGGGRKEEETTHEDTFEDIFTHSLYATSPCLMSLSYRRLPGLCWRHLLAWLKGGGGVELRSLAGELGTTNSPSSDPRDPAKLIAA